MVREISAGGVVLRKRGGIWWIAVIELPETAPGEELPAAANTNEGLIEVSGGETAAAASLAAKTEVARLALKSPESRKTSNSKRQTGKLKAVLALPKGAVDAGEKPLEAALREVREETGVTASLVTKLADIKYVYVRTWGDKARVFKIVSFYLLKYESGRINDIAPEMRIEVARARWVKLEDAPTLLAYRGEKQMARKALEYVMEKTEI